MEDDGSDAMDPQANEEFEPGALSSLEYPNSSDDIADITEIDPPEAHCDLGTNVNTNAMDPVDALTENVSACSDSDGEMETVQEASLGPNPEDVPANFQSEYEGSPRQGRAGLQQAIDNLMATEMEGKPDQPPESQASSLYEEGHYIQIPPWEEDATDNTNSNLDATVDHGTADKGKGRATEYDCQEEAYFTRHDLSDKIPWHAEEQFQRSEDPSFEKEVRFTKTKGEEESIQQPLEIRSENGENGSQQGDQELFVQETAIPETSSSADEQPDALGSKDSTPDARPKKKRVTLVPSEKEKAESRELGLRQLLGTDRASKMPILDLTEDKPSQRGTRQKTHRLSEKELESLWKPGSILSSANANASLPEIPTFTSTDKSKALNELIAALDPGDQPAAKSDRQRILEATRKFDHKPSSDGKGGWKVKGLNTSLYHHQVLAVGWMREREKSSTEPFGGLLCDVMGFGKTVTALTDILDGRKDEKRGPTLIVAPPGMIGHWADQVNRFFEPEIFGTITEYKSVSRMNAQYSLKGMQLFDVVLASYEDVRRSYPLSRLPKGLKSKEEIEEWWAANYGKFLGLLHKMKWQRIVLDEGHAIKNPASGTSLAIRALIGTHKWVVTGTPLHNCIEELFPYFNFIGVPKCKYIDEFQQAYCEEGARSRNRLIKTLSSILHRKTHDSRLFSRPILKLPGVTLRDEIVELCTAEKVLYVSIKQKFAELVNNLCSPKLKERQWRCILTMYLKLRMFTSHLLTAQDVVQAVLRIETLNVLKLLEGEQDTMDNSSRQIIKMIRLAKDGASAPVGETTPSEDEIPRLQPTGDREKLVREFKAFMEKLHEEERWQDSEGRVWCALCGFIPVRPIITSCKHLYCEECFHQLPDNEGVLGTENRLCNKCTTPIVEAAQFEVSPNVHSEETESSTSKDIPTNAKRKRQDKSKKPEASKRRKNASRGVQESAMFSEHDPQTDDNGEENEPCVDPISDDWIPMIGSQTPGAKLIRVRELLVKWIEENRDVKIIIFTQFLDTVRLLMMMCHQEGWGATKLTGKMAQIARDRSIISFREDPDLKVMISSLKTGGVGLDLSAANKCILLDLWWNEALQEQAYGRLYRNGQKREVEFVKIVAKGTIDENKLLQLQHEKTEKIRNVISQPVLENRKAFEEILKAFGNVTEVKGGGFRLELDP